MRAAARPSPVPAGAPLDRLQEALPQPVRGIPVQALLAWSGLLALGLVVSIPVLLRSNKAVEALEEEAPTATVTPKRVAPIRSLETAPKAPSGPSASELDAARLGGADTLAALAQRFPEDARVLEALCVAQARDKKDYAGSLRVLRHLFEVAPERRGDAEVREVVIDIANGPPDTASEAFELMKAKMGTYGPDALFDLLQLANGKYAKEHVAAALGDPEVAKSASKALLVADDLRRTLPCARKALVPRATAEGDGRSLPYLKQMVAANCKGLFRSAECFQCFSPSERAAIGAAIEAVEKREKREKH
jgi:hypothetical protein